MINRNYFANMKISSLLLALSLTTVASAKTQVCLYTNGKEICYDADKVDSISFFNDTLSMLNLHEYVDLGLPSGTKWATMNIGANAPEEFGDFFYWGGTHEQKLFSSNTTLTYKLELEELVAKGYCDENGVLTSEYDAATFNWGDGWRMPTTEEIEELVMYTTHETVTVNDVVGVMYTSKKNGESIFMPNAGYYNMEYLAQVGHNGAYWSSTYAVTNVENLFYEYKGSTFYSSGGFVSNSYRETGLPIRPVTTFEYKEVEEKESNPNEAKVTVVSNLTVSSSGSIGFGSKKNEFVDLGLPSGNLWSTCNWKTKSVTSDGVYTHWCWAVDTVCTLDIESLLSNGYIDSTFCVTPEYDACTQEMSDSWKTPSADDFAELFNNTEKEFVEVNNYVGLKLTGPNGNTIFFPGYRNDYLFEQFVEQIPTAEQVARYWTSTVNKDGVGEAISFSFSHKNNSVELESRQRSENFRYRPIVNLSNYKK